MFELYRPKKHDTLCTDAMKSRSVFPLTQKSVLYCERAVGEHTFKSHEVKDLVDGVVSSHDAHVPETRRKHLRCHRAARTEQLKLHPQTARMSQT